MLMACATTPMEARTFLDTLETGVDGIVIDVVDPSAVPAFKADDGEKTMDLEVAKVLEVRNLGMGDRVCIDTCSLMAPGEGMLVGSQSGCLFLVQSESESSGYVAPRPFRVNAGAVHSYVMGSDREGGSREVIVGRCKVEKRPLLLLRARVGELEYTTILQNAETVRMCTPNGSVSVSEIAPGDELLVMAEEGGRHFGMSVQESIQEL
jgi:3-dehydroquinate synthase II